VASVTRVASYARVSTEVQDPSGQVERLRAFAAARGWELTEFVDRGESGAKEHRPALDALMGDVGARRVDVVMVTKLDRLARSVRQLVSVAAEFEALSVGLVVLDQQLDSTTPAGRLLFHVLGAIAEFERDLIRDRVMAGVRRAQERGTKSGRPIGRPRRQADRGEIRHRRDEGQSWRTIARALKVPISTLRRLAGPCQKPGSELRPAVDTLAPVSAASEGVLTT